MDLTDRQQAVFLLIGHMEFPNRPDSRAQGTLFRPDPVAAQLQEAGLNPREAVRMLRQLSDVGLLQERPFQGARSGYVFTPQGRDAYQTEVAQGAPE